MGKHAVCICCNTINHFQAAAKATLEERASKNLKVIEKKLLANRGGQSFLEGDSVSVNSVTQYVQLPNSTTTW